MLILDTNICIYLMKGNPQVRERLRKEDTDDVVITSVSVYELFYGAEKSVNKEKL